MVIDICIPGNGKPPNPDSCAQGMSEATSTMPDAIVMDTALFLADGGIMFAAFVSRSWTDEVVLSRTLQDAINLVHLRQCAEIGQLVFRMVSLFPVGRNFVGLTRRRQLS
jgi:hypothetical protein